MSQPGQHASSMFLRQHDCDIIQLTNVWHCSLTGHSKHKCMRDRRCVPNVMITVSLIPIAIFLHFSPLHQQTHHRAVTPSCHKRCMVSCLFNFMSPVRMRVKSPSFSADHPDHLMLFRMYVSQNAPGKGRAVLEGVGLNAPTIKACFSSSPFDEEQAVQEGLIRWSEDKGTKPPTWEVLIAAMKFAGISQQKITGLKMALGLNGNVVCLRMCLHVHVCMHARARVCVCVVCIISAWCRFVWGVLFERMCWWAQYVVCTFMWYMFACSACICTCVYTCMYACACVMFTSVA